MPPSTLPMSTSGRMESHMAAIGSPLAVAPTYGATVSLPHSHGPQSPRTSQLHNNSSQTHHPHHGSSTNARAGYVPQYPYPYHPDYCMQPQDPARTAMPTLSRSAHPYGPLSPPPSAAMLQPAPGHASTLNGLGEVRPAATHHHHHRHHHRHRQSPDSRSSKLEPGSSPVRIPEVQPAPLMQNSIEAAVNSLGLDDVAGGFQRQPPYLHSRYSAQFPQQIHNPDAPGFPLEAYGREGPVASRSVTSEGDRSRIPYHPSVPPLAPSANMANGWHDYPASESARGYYALGEAGPWMPPSQATAYHRGMRYDYESGRGNAFSPAPPYSPIGPPSASSRVSVGASSSLPQTSSVPPPPPPPPTTYSHSGGQPDVKMTDRTNIRYEHLPPALPSSASAASRNSKPTAVPQYDARGYADPHLPIPSAGYEEAYRGSPVIGPAAQTQNREASYPRPSDSHTAPTTVNGSNGHSNGSRTSENTAPLAPTHKVRRDSNVPSSRPSQTPPPPFIAPPQSQLASMATGWYYHHHDHDHYHHFPPSYARREIGRPNEAGNVAQPPPPMPPYGQTSNERGHYKHETMMVESSSSKPAPPAPQQRNGTTGEGAYPPAGSGDQPTYSGSQTNGPSDDGYHIRHHGKAAVQSAGLVIPKSSNTITGYNASVTNCTSEDGVLQFLQGGSRSAGNVHDAYRPAGVYSPGDEEVATSSTYPPPPPPPPPPPTTTAQTAQPATTTGTSTTTTTTTTITTTGHVTRFQILPRRYQCNICTKRFSRPSSLKTHMHSHTGEKPYVCTVDGCARKFSVLSNLRRHMKVCLTRGAGGLEGDRHESVSGVEDNGESSGSNNDSILAKKENGGRRGSTEEFAFQQHASTSSTALGGIIAPSQSSSSQTAQPFRGQDASNYSDEEDDGDTDGSEDDGLSTGSQSSRRKGVTPAAAASNPSTSRARSMDPQYVKRESSADNGRRRQVRKHLAAARRHHERLHNQQIQFQGEAQGMEWTDRDGRHNFPGPPMASRYADGYASVDNNGASNGSGNSSGESRGTGTSYASDSAGLTASASLSLQDQQRGPRDASYPYMPPSHSYRHLAQDPSSSYSSSVYHPQFSYNVPPPPPPPGYMIHPAYGNGEYYRRYPEYPAYEEYGYHHRRASGNQAQDQYYMYPPMANRPSANQYHSNPPPPTYNNITHSTNSSAAQPQGPAHEPNTDDDDEKNSNSGSGSSCSSGNGASSGSGAESGSAGTSAGNSSRGSGGTDNGSAGSNSSGNTTAVASSNSGSSTKQNGGEDLSEGVVHRPPRKRFAPEVNASDRSSTESSRSGSRGSGGDSGNDTAGPREDERKRIRVGSGSR